MIRRLALAVGDTAGHVIPALAIAEAFRVRAGETDIRFFAAGEGPGHWLVERAGFPLDYVPGSQIARTTRTMQAVALWRAAQGTARARTLLVRHGARLVIGTGGYGSAGALLAARSLGLRTALIEPNAVPGLANRLLGRIADRAYLAFDETAGLFPHGRSLVTGVPIRPAAVSTDVRRPPLLPRLRLLVMSGSRGEQFLGDRMPALCDVLQHGGLQLDVHHQGGAVTAQIEASYARLQVQARVEPFIGDVPAALAWADVAITRAGAGTMAELAAAGVPTLLVPLGDAAGDHQSQNARALTRRGAALMVREPDWDTHQVASSLLALATDTSAWQSMSDAMRSLASCNSAARIVDDCEQMMVGRW
jgi:UDP-N-acetylglucosamine--N-acetylmuramyl-(pentapeptide) pyrophosphoryl-undecaprenol N-acetylglucosamine transferase